MSALAHYTAMAEQAKRISNGMVRREPDPEIAESRDWFAEHEELVDMIVREPRADAYKVLRRRLWQLFDDAMADARQQGAQQ